MLTSKLESQPVNAVFIYNTRFMPHIKSQKWQRLASWLYLVLSINYGHSFMLSILFLYYV